MKTARKKPAARPAIKRKRSAVGGDPATTRQMLVKLDVDLTELREMYHHIARNRGENGMTGQPGITNDEMVSSLKVFETRIAGVLLGSVDLVEDDRKGGHWLSPRRVIRTVMERLRGHQTEVSQQLSTVMLKLQDFDHVVTAAQELGQVRDPHYGVERVVQLREHLAVQCAHVRRLTAEKETLVIANRELGRQAEEARMPEHTSQLKQLLRELQALPVHPGDFLDAVRAGRLGLAVVELKRRWPLPVAWAEGANGTSQPR